MLFKSLHIFTRTVARDVPILFRPFQVQRWIRCAPHNPVLGAAVSDQLAKPQAVATETRSLPLGTLVKTIKRDTTALSRYFRALFKMKHFQRNNLNIPLVFEQLVKKHPEKACIIFQDRVWTFKQINDLSNKVAHVFEDAGFKPGDSVSLLMENRPEYPAIWMGLAKAGIVTALINHHLKSDALVHSMKIVDSKAVIYDAVFSDVVDEVRSQLDPSVALYNFDAGARPLPAWAKNLDALLDSAPTTPLAGPQRRDCNDNLLYIFTSGTTGMPKAAIIRHSRYALYAASVYCMSGMTPNDIIYITLPLYHSTGGGTSLGQTLYSGMTTVLARKFSVSGFWSEASRHRVTIISYIGEICRYLLAAPEVPQEKQHNARIMFGNGLRPQIWEEFAKRFQVPKIMEVYGGTESISNTMNYEGVFGAVGFMSVAFPTFYPIALIKVDDDGEPIRGPDGFCIRCKPREPGMFIAMTFKGHPIRDFDGYIDRKESQKKIGRDIFKRGDSAFLSGDLLEMDELGYLYFVDRLGDTFRWHGENVSTAEVEATIGKVAGLKDCTVYGVKVPGYEGRAGMAAILDNDQNLDLTVLAQGLTKVLPTYARPLFIRTVSAIDMTGTYKLRKATYQKEGFDPSAVKDDLYFFDSKSQQYVPLSSELYEKLLTGKMRI